MNQVIASLVIAAAMAMGTIVPHAPRAAPTMDALLASPTTTISGNCADCDDCWGDRHEAYMTDGDGGWTVQVCDFGSNCLVPCVWEEEQEEQEQVMLRPEQQIDVSDRLLSQDPIAGWEVLQSFPKAVDFVAERGSIQLRGCQRAIVANLPLTEAQIDYILAQQ